MSKKNQIVRRNAIEVRTLVGGTIIGAIVGLLSAFLLTRRAARKGRAVALTPMEGVQIAVLLFGLLRAIAALGDEK